MIDNFLNDYSRDKSQNRIVQILDNFDFWKNKYLNDSNIATHLRQELNGTLDIILYAIEHFMIEKNISVDIQNEYLKIKDDYITDTDLATLKITKMLASEKPFGDNDKSILKEKIINDDIKLFNFLKYINSLPYVQNSKDIINLTSYSSVFADSGNPEIIHPCKPDSTILWESNTSPNDHWLLIDFNKTSFVDKVEIIHTGISGLITSDYELQISNDGHLFVTLESIKNNNKFKTTYYLYGIQCRFIRLYITKASEYECNTKIRGLQIWGKYNN